jgi:hypothetical protein
MKAKDVLEIEVGIKNLREKNKLFMERRFMLRFLNKLDPALACKGRIIITGRDLEQLLKLQEESKSAEPKEATSLDIVKTKSQTCKLKKDLIR